MINKKFNIRGMEQKKKIKEFKEIINQIDKDSIIEAFKLGLDIGYFKGCTAMNDLFLQFNDGKDFVYTIIRMPIRKMKMSPTSPVATSVINTKTMKGRKF